jgi:hypothetical protein
MRLATLTMAAGLAIAAASLSANAAPVLPNLKDQTALNLKDRTASNIVQVAQRCGRGFHRNARGFCVRN